MEVTTVTPIDPASPKGRDLAVRLTGLLARIELEIADRKRIEGRKAA